MTDLICICLMAMALFFGTAASANAYLGEKWAGYAMTSVVSFSLVFGFRLLGIP